MSYINSTSAVFHDWDYNTNKLNNLATKLHKAKVFSFDS